MSNFFIRNEYIFKFSLAQTTNTILCYETFLKFQAIKDGLARVNTFRIKRKSGCKPLADILKEKCDFTRPSDPKEKVKVTITGMGGHVFKRELEESLDIS